VASGTWKSRLLVDYRELGTYGGHAAGIGEFVVDLYRVKPWEAPPVLSARSRPRARG